MKKARNKGKEIMKVVAICVLSIGLFGAGFIAFNRSIFAAAINGTQALPLETASVTAPLNPSSQQSPGEELQTEPTVDVFTPPTLTVIGSPALNQHTNNTVSAHAMSMEEAAQIGALYIWDIFGECIDGMYVEMLFGAWPDLSRTYWMGGVARSMAGFDFEDDTEYDLFRFVIDAVTGLRIDISPGFRPPTMTPEEMDIFSEWRGSETRRDWQIVWQDMNTNERLAYLGLSHEDIEPHLQVARDYAARQFNTSTVVYESLSFELWATTNLTTGKMVFGGIMAAIEDDAGREAMISICENGNLRHISTQFSDLIPGFYYGGNGLG